MLAYFRFVLPLLFLICGSYLQAQEFTIHPYLQDLDQHRVTIMWEVLGTTTGEVMYGVDPFELDASSPSTAASVQPSYYVHTSHLSDLQSDTKYYYRVSLENGSQSTLRTFVTLPSPEADRDVQMIAISDMQRDNSQPSKYQDLIETGIITQIHEEIGSSLSDLEAVLIPGDLVATGGNFNHWRQHFFGASDSLIGYVPIYPVPGNHEYFGGGLPNYKHYLSLPDNGPSSDLRDECWYKDISNVRIIGLNSNSGPTDQNIQLNWLHDQLADVCHDAHIDFVFAELHHPYKSELWTPGESDFTGKVIDSLEQFSSNCDKASVHFFGHTHGYSRGQSRDHKHLWVNVATAGGAIDNWGEFPNADYKEFVKSQDEYGFVMLDAKAGYDPSFTMKRYSIGDQDVVTDNVLRDSLKILNLDLPPSQPTNMYPIGDTIAGACLLLKASEYLGFTDSIQASHWQVATDSLMESIIAEEWWQNENHYYETDLQADDDLTDVSIDNVATAGQYYWRVRYRNQNLAWSPWSASTSFYISTSNSTDTISLNLILNGDAESDIDHWSGDIESLQNAECNSVLPYQGAHNFAVGGICTDESDTGTASQSIDLSAYANQINADTVAITLSGYMRNYNGSDVPEMHIKLYRAAQLVATSQMVQGNTATWTAYHSTVHAPVGTDSCVVLLSGTRNAGSDNDSYFDALSVYLVKDVVCPQCIGDSDTDKDGDGYCSDLDCNDQDASIYPGANDRCDGIDRNCDGLAIVSDTVAWVGLGDGTSWEDAENWDQQAIPQSCQHVIIDGQVTVLLSTSQPCYSLQLQEHSALTVDTNGTLMIDSDGSNAYASMIVNGSMQSYGRIIVENTEDHAITVAGVLINEGVLSTSTTIDESVVVQQGGLFSSEGVTVIR